MKVKDLLEMEIDIDVYDNYDERLGIAFVGPAKLTAKGEETFGEVLDLDVEIVGDGCCAIVDTEDDEEMTQMACDLFVALAGYCSETDYEEWFEEVGA